MIRDVDGCGSSVAIGLLRSAWNTHGWWNAASDGASADCGQRDAALWEVLPCYLAIDVSWEFSVVLVFPDKSVMQVMQRAWMDRALERFAELHLGSRSAEASGNIGHIHIYNYIYIYPYISNICRHSIPSK